MGKRASYDNADYTPKSYHGELREVLKTEFSERFVDGMRDRMIVSRYKYGLVADACPERINSVDNAKQRIAKYLETGNSEWLMDAANFLMMEYMHPKLDNAHYRPTDSHESIGRLRQDGSQDADPNLPPDDSVSRLRERYTRSGD